jgi:F-type H+-transporting ATPase subunit a
MEKLEHPLLIVDLVNALLAPLFALFGVHAEAGEHLIPNYLVMSGLIVLGFLVLGLLVRSRLSVDNPGRLQIVLEDLVMALVGLLDQYVGAQGRRFLPLVGSLGAFILAGNYLGLVPGFMAPTSNINVTFGCAVTAWVYYHLEGIRAQGLVAYIKHFGGPAGVPVFMVPLMFVIETISHLSRVLSLSLRLFGNIFGEELVIMILGMIIPFFPFLIPVPMMALGLITGGLQAFIFVLLTTIYLQGAVVSEHHHDDGHEAHGYDSGHLVATVET